MTLTRQSKGVLHIVPAVPKTRSMLMVPTIARSESDSDSAHLARCSRSSRGASVMKAGPEASHAGYSRCTSCEGVDSARA